MIQSISEIKIYKTIQKPPLGVGVYENRHPHSYHAGAHAELDEKVWLWRIYSPGTPEL